MRAPARPRRVAGLPAPAGAGGQAGDTGDRAAGGDTTGRTGAADAAPATRPDVPHGTPPPAPGVPAPRTRVPAADGTSRALAVPRRRGWAPVRPPVVSTSSAARFAERAALQRRLTRRRAVWAGSGLAVALALAWLLLVSPVLALDVARLEVRGQGTVVDPAVVTAVVAAHDRTPLPRLDTVGLRREVLDVPGVRAAEVERLWPHGLRVTVVSREPVAAVPRESRDGSPGFALLDEEGVQVGRSEAAPAGLPVVSVPEEDPGARAMTAVLAVLQRLPPELLSQVVAASADSQDTVRFDLVDGARVEWGSADQTALKARVLQTLRAAEASRSATVFDVSAPTLPITTS